MVKALERGLTRKLSKCYSIRAVNTNNWAPSGRHDWKDDGADDKMLPRSNEMMGQKEDSELTCDMSDSNLENRVQQLESGTNEM